MSNMKKFSAFLISLVFTVFTIMPLSLLLSYGFFGDCTAGMPVYLGIILFTVLIAYLPAYVGNYKVETIISGGGGTLDMYRERPEVIQKKSGHRFPLRWGVFVIMLAAVMIFSVAVPYVRDIAWLPRAGYSLILLVGSCILVCVVANPKASFVGFLGTLIGVFMYLTAGLALWILRNAEISKLTTWVQTCMMIYIFMCVFMLNSHSMLQGYNAKGTTKPASRIARSNRLMVTGFGVVLLLVMMSTHIRNFFSWLGAKIGGMFVGFVQWIFSLIPKGIYVPPQSDEGLEAYSFGDNFMITEPVETNEFWLKSENYLRIVGMVIAAILILIALFKVFQGLRILWRKLLVLIRKYAKNVSEEYEDEHESLLEWDDMRREMGESIRSRIQKLVTREKKYSQLEARERVRYIIRELYRREGGNYSAKTLREASGGIDFRKADAASACELYERARYSDKTVSNEEADKLKEAVEI
ncbi:MAG: hypothetical protein E7335_04695 [Clostridiales bacterium]|nr:hypothetical protein [Clostridiales bacterium]